MEQQLHEIFQATLSADLQIRTAAEGKLEELKGTPGYATALFRVAAEDTVDPNIRLGAAIQFKNVLTLHWEEVEGLEDKSAIPEQEKAPLRTLIPEALSSLPPLVRAQCAVGLRHVIYADWPERLPGIVDLALAEIKKQTPQSLHGGLTILRLLCKKYEYKTEEDKRTPFEALTVHIFPMLQDLLEHLLNLKGFESAELQRLILKAVWSSMHLALPDMFLQTAHFQRWAQLLNAVLTKPVQECHDPPLTLSQIQDSTLPYWKVRKWAIAIVVNLVERYVQPKQCKGKKKEFAHIFLEHFAGPFLNTILVVIGMRAQYGWLPDRILHQALCYVNECVPVAQVYKILKPHLRPLIFQVVQPILRFEQAHLDIWSDNPVEFVRQEYSLDEEWYAPKPQAINLLSDLSRQRTKDTLDIYMEYCSKVLQEYAATPDKTAFEKAAEKDGVMLGIGTVLPKIIKKKKYQDVLEPLFLTFIVPEFESPVGFLRSRACWFAGVLGGVKVKDEAAHRAAVHGLLQRLSDPELPVRIEAAHSLFDYLKMEWVLAEIKPLLGQLLQTYFTLINEVGVDEVVRTLAMLVSQLEEEVVPYAQQIIATAAQTFLRYHKSDEDEDASSMAQMECLSLIPTVLSGMIQGDMEAHRGIVTQTEPILVPILREALVNSFEYLTELLQIMALLTYAGTGISEDLWSLYPIIVKVFDEFAWDYLDEMIPAFDNYIERGTDVFLAHPEYVQGACHVVEKVLKNEDSSEKDCQPACAIIESIVLNCIGRIDHLIGPFFNLVVDRMAFTENLPLMTNLMDCLGDMIYYNPKLTLQLAVEKGCLDAMLAKMLELAPGYTRMYDKKVAILAFSSILKMDAAALAPIQNHLTGILDRTVSLIVALRQDKAKQGAEEEDEDDDGSHGGWATDDELDDDDDALKEEDVAKFNKLIEDVQAHVDSWDEGADLDDIDDYESPLDKVDEGAAFLEALNSLNATVPAFVPSLGIGAQAMLNSVVSQIQTDLHQAAAGAGGAAQAPQTLGFNPVMHPGSPQ